MDDLASRTQAKDAKVQRTYEVTAADGTRIACVTYSDIHGDYVRGMLRIRYVDGARTTRVLDAAETARVMRLIFSQK